MANGLEIGQFLTNPNQLQLRTPPLDPGVAQALQPQVLGGQQALVGPQIGSLLTGASPELAQRMALQAGATHAPQAPLPQVPGAGIVDQTLDTLKNAPSLGAELLTDFFQQPAFTATGEILSDIQADFERDIPRNPVIGTIKEVPGVVRRGIANLAGGTEETQTQLPAPVDETPIAEPAPEEPAGTGVKVSIETQDPTEVGGLDQQQQGEIQKGIFESNPELSTMMMAVGVSLLQGKDIGTAIANGMQAMGKQKQLQAQAAAGARAEAREDRKLDIDERKARAAERKALAETRKLSAEVKKIEKGGSTEDLQKLRVSFFEKIAQGTEGLNMTNEQIAGEVEKLLKRFAEGTAEQDAADDDIRLALESVPAEDRREAAKRLIESGAATLEQIRRIAGG